MGLLAAQEELLVALVEAARKVPRHEQQFLLTSFEVDQEIASIDQVQGAGLDGPLRVLGEDVWALDRAGLLNGSWNLDGGARFTVSAAGFAAYEVLRRRAAEPAAAVEQEVARYLDGTQFSERFPVAQEKLAAAETMLWRSKPEDDLTTIGHKLREAMQQFATAMVERHQPPDVDPDPDKTKRRLRAVVDLHRERLGERKAALLVALVDYQDAVNDVIQRQEHGDQKPGNPLTWEDARAAVFQTVVLFHEFDRLLNA